jgi:hypothetical protein
MFVFEQAQSRPPKKQFAPVNGTRKSPSASLQVMGRYDLNQGFTDVPSL